MARTDDIINVAGHRLSTGAMEEVLAAHPDVAECAVIGIADAMKGQVPLGFVVLNAGVARDSGTIENEVVGLVRERIGPVAAFKTVVTIKRLPKTRSGKILRGTMQKIADKEAWSMPATIDDPAILDEITAALKGRGIGRRRHQSPSAGYYEVRVLQPARPAILVQYGCPFSIGGMQPPVEFPGRSMYPLCKRGMTALHKTTIIFSQVTSLKPWPCFSDRQNPELLRVSA